MRTTSGSGLHLEMRLKELLWGLVKYAAKLPGRYIMGLLGNLQGKVGDWLFSVALKKAAIRVAAAVASFITAHQLGKYGLTLNVDPDALAAAFLAALEVARNYLKVKKGLSWL